MHFPGNFLTGLLASLLLYAPAAFAQTDPRRPNIVFILTDDQDLRMNSLDHMQQVQKLLIDEGTSFVKHYVHSALCCPSRLTLWSGQHAHNTNVTSVKMPGGGWEKIQNNGYWDKYLPVWLSDHGYNTYYAGKLYNEHTRKNFDRQGKFAAGWTESDFLVHPKVYSYYNSTFQHNRGDQHDDAKPVTGYSTNKISNYTLGYLDDAIQEQKPFFAVAAPVAPHIGTNGFPTPEKKYDGKFPDVKIPRAPNFNPDEKSGVLHIHDLAQIQNQTYLDDLDKFQQKRIETLQSVDDMVEQIVRKLEERGVLDNTYIIYTTDNGYHIGHHRMAPGKKCGYEEDVNVPMIIRGPQIAKGRESDLVTAHVDVAPTIMNMVGLEPDPEKHKLDGQGLELPLLSQKDFDKAKESRGEHVNIEMWGPYQQEGRGHPNVAGLNEFKTLRIQGDGYNLMYAVWCQENAHELYDMTNDEYQMNNLYPGANKNDSSDAQELLGRPIRNLADRLDALLLVQKSCKQAQCTKPWEQLHPDGEVKNLKDALQEKYDGQYASYPKVKFDRCVKGAVYIPETEGPMWDNVEVPSQASMLMRECGRPLPFLREVGWEMLLCQLPDELLLLVVDQFETERDFSALVRTCRYLYQTLNTHLYRHNVRHARGTALLFAARRGQLTTATKLIEQGANVGVERSPGRTPLLLAVENGHADMVELLLKTGRADVTLKEHGRSPLWAAAFVGFPAVVKVLLAADGVHPEDGAPEGPPLLWAARNGHVEVVDLLLETGKVDPNKTWREYGPTPIWEAADYGHEEVVKRLLAVDGIDPDPHVLEGEDDTGTPLLRVAMTGCGGIVRLLLATGKVDPDPHDYVGCTPLMCAVGQGHKTVAEQLIATGKVDIESKTVYGWRPLYMAVHERRIDIAHLLLEKGAEVNATNEAGSTALHVAARSGFVDLAQLLLQSGASTEQQCDKGWTALHLAARAGSLAIMELLLHYGAEVNAAAKESDNRPLHIAVSHSRLDMAKLLLEHRADIELTGGRAWTPLHYAAHYAADDMVRLLIDNKAPVDAVDGEQRSALHLASRSGKLGVMTLLLDRGANLNLQDGFGWTALVYATNNAHQTCVRELLDRGARVRSAEEYRAILHAAACEGDIEVIELLEQRKNDPFAPDGSCFLEALQLACIHGRDEVAQYLVRPDTDPEKADKHGWTLFHSLNNTLSSTVRLLPEAILPGVDVPPRGTYVPLRPSCLSATDKSPCLSFPEPGNYTRVVYTGPEKGRLAGPGSIRANHPFPLLRDMYSLEVKLLNADGCRIAIGLCHGHAPLDNLPGLHPYSCAYHSYDGNFYENESETEEYNPDHEADMHEAKGYRYGPICMTGDVIGCVFDVNARSLVFYKNETCLGVAPSKDIQGKLYAVVGMEGYGAEVEVNFGSKPLLGP